MSNHLKVYDDHVPDLTAAAAQVRPCPTFLSQDILCEDRTM